MRIDEKYKRLIKCFFSVVMILLLTVTYHQFWVRYYNKIILYPFYRRGMWMMAGIYAAMLWMADGILPGGGGDYRSPVHVQFRRGRGCGGSGRGPAHESAFLGTDFFPDRRRSYADYRKYSDVRICGIKMKKVDFGNVIV